MSGETPKRALVTGITGQDGSYLAELLLEKGYEVHGIIRRSSSFNTGRIDHLYKDPTNRRAPLLPLRGPHRRGRAGQADLRAAARRDLQPRRPEPCPGHLRHPGVHRRLTASARAAAGSDPRVGGEDALLPGLFLRDLRLGAAAADRDDAVLPAQPVRGRQGRRLLATVNYRESYEMFAVNGILFNHESPRRGETFVTRKITRAVARIKAGLQDKLYMGNLDAERDWGYAPDYVEAMWLMLQPDEPDDYVVATGETHSVREFLEVAFAQPASTATSTSRSTRATTAPPRWTRSRRREQGPREAGLGAEGALPRADRADGRRRRRALDEQLSGRPPVSADVPRPRFLAGQGSRGHRRGRLPRQAHRADADRAREPTCGSRAQPSTT